MKHAGKAFETESFAAIVKDLEAARREARFEDALHHLDEILIIHQHTESDPLKARCAVLLGVPESLRKAA